MNYSVDTNIVFEDNSMKTCAWEMQGYEAWKWFFSFDPIELNSFP